MILLSENGDVILLSENGDDRPSGLDLRTKKYKKQQFSTEVSLT